MASSTWSGERPRRHVVPVEGGANCSSVDAELGTQLVGGRACLIALDESLDLVGVELPCPSGFGPADGRWSRCSGVGQLPEQDLQGFYLRFCVVVSSPKVHNVSQPEPSAFWTGGSDSCLSRYEDCLGRCCVAQGVWAGPASDDRQVDDKIGEVDQRQRRWVTASISTVAYLRPRLIATSSTLSTFTVPTSGSGTACTNPSRVPRLAASPSRAARRAPARPANASPMRSNTLRHNEVRRPCRPVSPSTCSAHVRAAQPIASQKNRRTRNRSATDWPATATSARLRSYRLCTRRERPPHDGQVPSSARTRAQTSTPAPDHSTFSISTPATCGSNTLNWSSHAGHDHRGTADPDTQPTKSITKL